MKNMMDAQTNKFVQPEKEHSQRKLNRTLSEADSLAMLKNLAFVEIISADNDRYTEEVKQEVLTRHKETPEDWEYILEPIGDDAEMYLKIFRA